MLASQSDRNVLFGVLALQMEFITQSGLIAALQAWTLQKSKLLGELLVELGHMSAEDRAALEPMVDRHIARHGGSPEQSLAALSSVGSACEALQSIGDPNLGATLLHLRPPAEPRDALEQTTAPSNSARAPNSDNRDAPRRFRVIRPHAKGGMGEVFVANDEELNREVALKEIQPKFSENADSRSRFRLEAEITGNLEHPGIVPVYGLGQYSDGRPFYAMRFIRGDSLKEAIESFHKRFALSSGQRMTDSDASLELRKLLGRFVDVCNAIEYAHSRGVLHRDLKPGNVVLGKYGETLVVDWGLAKALGKTDHLDASMAPVTPSGDSGSVPTLVGSAIGTPAYMSPEQAAGRVSELGPATDIYSLGASLYHLLTGQPPVKGKSLSEILQLVQSGRFPTPRQVRSDVSLALEAICLKAMSLQPESRYPSPLTLAEDIERWLADEPVSAYREPLLVRGKRFVRRHQVAVTSLAAAVIVALVGLGVLSAVVSASNQRLNSANATISARNEDLRQSNEQLAAARTDAEQKRDEAIAQKTRADEQAAIATAVNDFLRNDLLGQADIANQELANGERNQNITVRELLDRSAESINDKFQDQPFVQAAIRQTIGGTYLSLQRFDDAERHLTLALNVQRLTLGEEHIDTAKTMTQLATMFRAQARFDEAEALYKRVLEAMSKTLGEDHVDTLTALSNLANLYDDRGQPELAEKLLKQALDRKRRTLGDASLDSIPTMNSLAILYKKSGRFEEAEALYKSCMSIGQQQLGADHPQTLLITTNLATLYHECDRFDEAERLFTETLNIQQEKLGEDNSWTLTTMNNLAELYRARGRFEEAESLSKRVLELNQKKFGTDHPRTLTGLNNLASFYRSRGQYAEAEELYKRVLEVQRSKLGEDHLSTLTSMNNLAGLYKKVARYVEAEQLYKQALEHLQRKYGDDHPDTFLVMNNMADLYLTLGRYNEAEPLIQKVIERREQKFGADDLRTLTSRSRLASLYRSTGRFGQAEILYKQVLDATRQKLGADHPDTLTSMNNLASVYGSLNRHIESEPLYKSVLELRQQRLGQEHPDTLLSMNNLAHCNQALGRVTEAETLHQQALEGHTKALGKNHPDTLLSMSNLAEIYRKQNRFAEAEPLAKKALAGRRHALGDDHPHTLTSFNNLAFLEQSQLHFEEAEPLFRSALSGAKQRLGMSHPKTQLYTRNLLAMYQEINKLDAAEPLLRDLAEVQQQKSKADSFDYAQALIPLGVNLIAQRKDAEGTVTLEAAGEILKRDEKAGPASATYASFLTQWAEELLKTQQFEAAEAKFREELTIRQKLSPEGWTVFRVQSLIGASLTGQKKFADAEQLLLSGYAGLSAAESAKKIPAVAKSRPTKALQQLIDLYIAWDKPEQAAEWQKKLDELTQAKESTK